MSYPESGFQDPEAVIDAAILEILAEFVDHHKRPIPYGETDLQGLIDRARAGEEIEIPIVSGIWTQQYTSESEALRRSLDGGWAFSFQEWLWEHGQRMEGFASEELRDPMTGRLVHPGFIRKLIETGKAVELTTREDEARGTVTVNNEWGLWRSYQVEGFVPLATVNTADADVGEMAGWYQMYKNGPHSMEVPYPVSVGKKLIILPGLELPQVD
jgi:hypothetical protein